AAADDTLAWTAWLPHVAAGPAEAHPAWIGNTPATRAARLAELRDLVATRVRERRGADTRFPEDVVVLLDGALTLRELPGAWEVLRDGPTVGVYPICVDRYGLDDCPARCELGDAASMWFTRGPGHVPTPVRPDGLAAPQAIRLARALAPMRDPLAARDPAI